MFTHEQVWRSIDDLAGRHGLSPSALAIKAGLSATALNKSKRVMTNGRPRWPSTETISKILEAAGEPVESFLINAKEKS